MWFSWLISLSLFIHSFSPQPAPVSIQVLSLNDFHGQLNTTSALQGKKTGRADYVSAYLLAELKHQPHTLLVHAGDMVGGSPAISALRQDEPAMAFLNTLPFTAGTLGNHEFDHGVTEMERLIHGGTHPETGFFAGSAFPYISANVVDRESGQLLFPPYLIRTVNGIPIAFIGVTTTETPDVTLRENVASVSFLDEAEAINLSVQEIKKAGIRTIIVLAHVPGTTEGGATTGELADLAQAVDDEVDVIFGGHNHSYINGEVDGKLLLEGYSYGMAYAKAELQIDPITKDVIHKTGKVILVDQDRIQPDQTVTRLLHHWEADARQADTIISSSTASLTRQNGALGNMLAQAQRKAVGADIAFVNAGSIRSDLQTGSITWGSLFSVQPFRHRIMKLQMTGRQIQEVLAEQWNGRKEPLYAAGLHYDAVSFPISLDDGRPFDDRQVYTVAVNSFLAQGGDRFFAFTKGSILAEGPTDFDVLLQYMQHAP
ncbi:bifunctional metallophosphatase/5'-nucleotidase [Ectobacillus ponti]|uniref:Bifunctional metallophosphatase/5'-nucleotidase n=1 Tax=Ectobacillus ponti TaxID=2961894 RepID=A0AA42BSQ2_9BACI|nr:bifunctional metallophosphatase/5'-nucleotidase [Ectobacillus ponti]MCP8968683.1 bifunctional metallophosphatase/5'-nucleotidase [Ectobacillus ponti]